MKRNLERINQVSVCHKESCIHAIGKNANLVTKGVLVMLLLIGVATIIRAVNS